VAKRWFESWSRLRRCKRCLLPGAVPEAQLDADGVCALCRSYRPDDDPTASRARTALQADLEQALEGSRRSGAAYNALVCLSGGKDSLYLLHRLKVEYKLEILAFTTDANIPAVAWSSMERTVRKLGVDHLVHRPSKEFYRKLFRYLLQNQEARGAVYTVSYVYAPLFEGDALAVATERGIPLVLAGYSPGQPEPDRMKYEYSQKLIAETDWTPPSLRDSGQLTPAELARFWNPARYPKGTRFPRYLAPFHAWEYDQDRIMQRVSELGLVARRAHASPVHSNYPINWLLMYSDLAHFGYNPYAPEFCALIRAGKANRLYWKFMAPFVDFMIRRKVLLGRNTAEQMRWLGLTESDLRITRPRGAYDPKLD
jgi:hypothetical protein